MEFYIALPYITYSEAYDFCKGSELKNMTTIVAIRTPNEDKKLPKIVSIEKSQKSTFFVLVTGVF